jgi:hypothetical protein
MTRQVYHRTGMLRDDRAQPMVLTLYLSRNAEAAEAMPASANTIPKYQ